MFPEILSSYVLQQTETRFVHFKQHSISVKQGEKRNAANRHAGRALSTLHTASRGFPDPPQNMEDMTTATG
ncbi:MAG: hypothetical protein QM743_13320 [Chitinophagaceae bacterium]